MIGNIVRNMIEKQLAIIFVLTLGAFTLNAQDVPVIKEGGSFAKADTVRSVPEAFPMMNIHILPSIVMPEMVLPLQGVYETKEQKAARINSATYNVVKQSVARNLSDYSLHLTPVEKGALMLASLFLSNPFGFPAGCVPMMNHSFPFVYAVVPGMAPYETQYSPDNYPQCVRLEYDIATGTYIQTMVSWDEYQKNLSKSLNFNSRQPVPDIPVTPVERMLR